MLHAPQIIKNLISVRKFTTDNHVYMEFDPFGFHVKDLLTGNIILRCDSTGDLYPLFSSVSPAPAFAALSTTTWHNRLGHPGAPILNSLKSNNVISCTSHSGVCFCHSCQIGKHIKLPFSPSNNDTIAPFDIVHSDLWTSPTLSSMGHRYYILFLDDYTNFLWTFPLTNKSQVLSTFITFRDFIHTQFERKIKSFQCDNGREFDNSLFHK